MRKEQKRKVIDTNIFLRLFLKDIQSQFKEAKSILQNGVQGKEILFVPLTVMFEINYVLIKAYKVPKEDRLRILQNILQMTFIEFENKYSFEIAFTIYKEKNLELEDCYVIASAIKREIDAIYSFDTKLQKVFKTYLTKLKTP